MKRLILIHGYVEDPTIFDALVPLLPSTNIVRISVEDEFDRWPVKTPVNAYALAQFLATAYAITADDVVIGHSMGGWVAINLKAVTGATAIQIASYTDQRKPVSPIYNLAVIGFLANTGLMQSKLALTYVKKKYPFDESRALNYTFLDRLSVMRRAYISWQMSVLFAPVPPLTVSPDLRIHTRTDNIVTPPDEPYTLVPGDHFCLVFHPVEVASAIRSLFIARQFPVQANPTVSL